MMRWRRQRNPRDAQETRRSARGLAMILAEAIRTARDADIVGAADRLGIALKAGRANQRTGRCPKCNSDAFIISVKQKSWRCARCDKGGVAVDLVMHAQSCSFREAVGFLSETKAT